jgi:hypothetical protein
METRIGPTAVGTLIIFDLDGARELPFSAPTELSAILGTVLFSGYKQVLQRSLSATMQLRKISFE